MMRPARRASSMASERDPRVDPRPGDVLCKQEKRLMFSRWVKCVLGCEILYSDIAGQACAASSRGWRKWASNAEVIHVALEPK